MSAGFTEIFAVSQLPNVSETGGAHNQKGIEFQKHWALTKMLDLESSGAEDFLFLFEVVQDVAVVNSETAPTAVEVYQLKKKDRGEWTWSSLTALHEPQDPTTSRRKLKEKPLADVKFSPLGKLYVAVRSFASLNSSGRFISNAGCDLTMSDGTNAATSRPVSLNLLPPHFLVQITDALSTTHRAGEAPADPSSLVLEKASIPVDDPLTYTVGKAHQFLMGRSPSHAGQARALVESLLAKISPLGSRTVACRSYEDIRSRHGYSRGDLVAALGALEGVVNASAFFDRWLAQLQTEGLGVGEITQVAIALTELYRRKLLGTTLQSDQLVAQAASNWLEGARLPPLLRPLIDEAVTYLTMQFPKERLARLRAVTLLGAIEKCVDQS